MRWTILGAILLVVVWFSLRKVLKVKAIDHTIGKVDDDIRSLLESIAAAVSGKLASGNVLETPKGKLSLLATKAPKVAAADQIKFTAALPGSHLLHLIPAQDSATALHMPKLHPITLEDPAVSGAYLVLTSDDAFARSVVTGALVARLAALDEAVKGRSRIQIGPGSATVLILKGLSEPSELQAFHDGAAAVVEEVRSKVPA